MVQIDTMLSQAKGRRSSPTSAATATELALPALENARLHLAMLSANHPRQVIKKSTVVSGPTAQKSTEALYCMGLLKCHEQWYGD